MEYSDKVSIKVFVLAFLAYLIFIQVSGQNDETQLNTVLALAYENTFIIDSFHNNTMDKAYINGHYYSEKPPGLAFSTLPIYLVLESSLGQPDFGELEYMDPSQALFFLLLTSLTSSLAGAMCCLLFYKASGWYTKDEVLRLITTVAFAFGTLNFVVSRFFIRNSLATFLGFLAFYILKRRTTKASAIVSGFIFGYAVFSNYASILLLPIFFLFPKRREILLGLSIPLAFIFLHNYFVVGNPFDLPASHVDWFEFGDGVGTTSQLNLDPFRMLNTFIRVTIYPYRGLFFYSPVLLLSFLGLRSGRFRRENLVFIISFLLVAFYAASMSIWWGGASFQLRHFSIITPFLLLSATSTEKLNKKVVIVLVILSISVNLLGMQDREEIDSNYALLSGENIEKFNSFIPLGNPVFTHYLPLTVLNSPRSMVMEDIFSHVPKFLNLLLLMIATLLLLSRKRPIQKIVLGVFLIISVFFLFHSLLAVNHPFDIVPNEGVVLSFSALMRSGEPLYQDFEQLGNLMINIYPPWIYLIISSLHTFFENLFVPGRLVSLCSSFMISVMIFGVLHRKTKDKLISALFALSFFSIYPVVFWSSIVSPDLLYICLSLLGFFIIFNRQSEKRLVIGTVFFILAFLVKQNAIVAPIATFIYLFLNNRQEAMKFSVIFLTPLLILFFTIYSVTSRLMFENVYANIFLLTTFKTELLLTFFIISPLLILMSVHYVLKNWNSPFSIYFLVAVAVMLISLFNKGGSSNYLLEPVAIMVVLSGMTYGRYITHKRLRVLVSLLLIAQIPLSISGGNLNSNVFSNFEYVDSIFYNLESSITIDEFVKSSDGNVLIEFGGYVLKNNLAPPFDAWKIYEMESVGRIDTETTYNYCIESNFSMIFSFRNVDGIDGIKRCLDELYSSFRIIYLPIIEPNRYGSIFSFVPVTLYKRNELHE